jgi:hypothetical protein
VLKKRPTLGQRQLNVGRARPRGDIETLDMVMAPGHPGEVRDGRQSPAAFDICRGVARLLKAHGLAAVSEVALANGRRADVTGLSDSGEIWIVEIKSCLEDFRADQKWPEYREFCDRLFFAVAPDFPHEVLPVETGLIVADRYGGEVVRAAPEHRLAGARRKAMTVRLARTAALRLQGVIDPEGGFEGLPRE